MEVKAKRIKVKMVNFKELKKCMILFIIFSPKKIPPFLKRSIYIIKETLTLLRKHFNYQEDIEFIQFSPTLPTSVEITLKKIYQKVFLCVGKRNKRFKINGLKSKIYHITLWMSISKCHAKHILALSIIYFNKNFREVLKKKNIPNWSHPKMTKNVPISKINISFLQ